MPDIDTEWGTHVAGRPLAAAAAVPAVTWAGEAATALKAREPLRAMRRAMLLSLRRVPAICPLCVCVCVCVLWTRCFMCVCILNGRKNRHETREARDFPLDLYKAPHT